MYTIQKFILSKMQEKQISRVEFVNRIGYHNIAKGLRRFDEFIKDNNFNKMILDNLHLALGESIEIVDCKFNETKIEIQKDIDAAKSLQEELERKSFVPFLYCHTERRVPSPIFVCAVLGADRIKVQKLLHNYNLLSVNDQEILRKELIVKLIEKYNGIIPTFGGIICFTLKRKYDDIEDEREVFDLNGIMIPSPLAEYKKISIGSTSISIKGKDITQLFQCLEWKRKSQRD